MPDFYASLWGHLDELRQTLFRCLVTIAIGFFVILGCYQPIMRFLTSSVHDANQMVQFKVERHFVQNPTVRDKVFELPDHALQKGTVKLSPGDNFTYDRLVTSPLLIMSPIEGLIAMFRIAFWGGLVLTLPLWGWTCLKFILPALKQEERLVLIPFICFSMISSATGAILAYHLTLPIANQYLALFNELLGQNAWTLTHYFNYLLFLCLGHAIAAEIAFVLLFLVHYRFLSSTFLISKRRLMIVLAFILGALLTPPDVLTQLLLALPLMGIYECAILYAKFRERPVINILFSQR